MTQSKPVKKKKVKTDKGKKNDKKGEKQRPPTPVDEKVEAEKNLREMIKEAHKIHKYHTASASAGSLKPILSEVSRKSSEKGKYTVKKREPTAKAGNASVTEVTSRETRLKVLEGRRSSEISAESRIKQFANHRRSSAEFTTRTKETAARRQGSAEFSPSEKEGSGMSKRHQEKFATKMNDYHVGTPPFVSLELLDKMKCHDSSASVHPKESILRQKRAAESRLSGADLKKPKAKTSDEKPKLEREGAKVKAKKRETCENEKRQNSPTAVEGSRNCGNADSGLTTTSSQKSLIRTCKSKSAASGPMSATSNFGRSLDTVAGGGDPFSSNTSHSYFSSDSDISKIDKKFMEILEAVTQRDFKLDFEAKPQYKSLDDTESKRDGSDLEYELERRELEQQLLRRINSLEQKLENAKLSTENEVIKEDGQEKVVDSAKVCKMASPVVEEIWIKESTFRDENSGVSLALNEDQKRREDLQLKSLGDLKKVVASDVEEICKSYDRCKKDECNKKMEGEEKISEKTAAGEWAGPSQGEGCKEKTQEVAMKKPALTGKVEHKAINKEGTETPKGDKQKDKSQNKPTEAWSIIKRLEKAFQTLGLNLEDLESSDEQSSAKKKQPLIKKRESFGKEKKNSPKSETLKRTHDNAECSSGSKKKPVDKRHTQIHDDVQYGVESNGSGDKNMEYKQVRSSSKVEDLKRISRRARDNANDAVYYASVSHRFPREEARELTVNLSKSLKQGRSDYGISKERVGTAISGMTLKCTQKAEGAARFDDKNKLRHGKKTKKTHVDDLLLSRRSSKRQSEYSLSASCSLSSFSGEDDFKHHKRKKKSVCYPAKPKSSEHGLRKTNTSGTGDATMEAVAELPNSSTHPQIGNGKKTSSLRLLHPSLPKIQETFKMEEKKNELELQQIRERHKQIISEIKTSLDEIKKQHNLFSKLRMQTKQFHKDCHVKRRLIAAYLRDVEEIHESENARRPVSEFDCKYRRALSTDSYSHRMRRRKRSKLRSKLSDYDLEETKLKKDEVRKFKKLRRNLPGRRNGSYESVLGILANGKETSSDEISSVASESTSTDFASTDSAEESFRTVMSSLKPTRRKKGGYRAESGKHARVLCLEWNRANADPFPACPENDSKKVPGFLVQLLEKLNRIILKERNHLEDLVVKASGSSSSSSKSSKTRAFGSSNSSDTNAPKRQHNPTEEVVRVTPNGYKTSSSNFSGNTGSRQSKSKAHGSRKSGHEKSAEVDADIPAARSRSIIQRDPGGSSTDSIIDPEQEIVISESFPNQNQAETHTPCPISCPHSDMQAEEFRYRKGDPSFRSRGHLHECVDEHARHCRRKTPEEEQAFRRKIELERILRADEKRRPGSFSRDSDGHALDFDSYHGGKGKHPGYMRHRQQSIIIDHNREEENEESQTVLGHASRHSGVGRNRKAPHEYLRADRKSDSSYQLRKREQEIWKKWGKRHHLDEVPVNYFEIALNAPGSSAGVSRDVDCQTDNVDEYDDAGDTYLWDESGSNHSIN